MEDSNSKIDMSLDEIIRREGGIRTGSKRPFKNRNNSNGGVRKSFGNRNNFQSNNRFNGNYRNNNRFGDRLRNRFQSNNNNRFNGNRFGGNRFRPNQPAVLHISNLAMNVTAEDLDELFSSFGYVTSAFVHFDKNGKSIGTGEVDFERRDDAIAARNKLNNVPLDGRPLTINIINRPGDDEFTSYLKSATWPNNRQHTTQRSQHGFRNNNQRRNNNRNNDKSNLSASDLDRELDEWRMQTDDAEVGGDAGI